MLLGLHYHELKPESLLRHSGGLMMQYSVPELSRTIKTLFNFLLTTPFPFPISQQFTQDKDIWTADLVTARHVRWCGFIRNMRKVWGLYVCFIKSRSKLRSFYDARVCPLCNKTRADSSKRIITTNVNLHMTLDYGRKCFIWWTKTPYPDQ